jgi:hypothetical protein
MSACTTCPAREIDATSSVYRLKMEKVARNLALLSQSAAYYALQVRNGHVDVLDEGVNEMEILLSGARSGGE